VSDVFHLASAGKTKHRLTELGRPELVGVTIVDDLDAAASGPTSFDRQSLDWWINRAIALVVDAAKPLPKLYQFFGSSAANGDRLLIVRTVEARRLLWHEFLRAARSPSRLAAVVDVMNNPGSEPARQLIRVGPLGDDFGPNRPSNPRSFAALAKQI
jgi:hypothetical protein